MADASQSPYVTELAAKADQVERWGDARAARDFQKAVQEAFDALADKRFSLGDEERRTVNKKH